MTRRRPACWVTAATLLVFLAWPNPAAAVSGTVEFRDGFGDRITSDGQGDYVDAVDRVQATLGDNFILDTNKTGTAAIRELDLDFTECVASSACNPPRTTFRVEALVRTTGHPDLEGLPVSASREANLQVFFPDPNGDDLQWFLRFNTDGALCNTGGRATQVQVTRTASDTWVIEAGSLDVACLLSLTTKGKGVMSHEGFTNAPFQLTFTAALGCVVTENPEVTCSDGVDNDCDGLVDGDDPDCGGVCLPAGDSCDLDADCCSNKCKGKPGNKTCR